jgi:hypothetical protein
MTWPDPKIRGGTAGATDLSRFRDSVGAAKQALPEGAQRALPLENGVARETAREDRVLAVAHE